MSLLLSVCAYVGWSLFAVLQARSVRPPFAKPIAPSAHQATTGGAVPPAPGPADLGTRPRSGWGGEAVPPQAAGPGYRRAVAQPPPAGLH